MTTSTTAAGARVASRRRGEVLRLRLMAAGFGTGSVLFGGGAAFAMIGGSIPVANWVFAIGAVFFTAAALVQVDTARAHFPAGPHRLRRGILDPDVSSAVIQFVGTLFFNIMTVRAIILPMSEYDAVWRPDVAGSMCFLVSSWIAWHPVVRKRRHELVAGRSRLILWANMAGSVFFGISAWGSELIRPGQFENSLWASLGTLLGAIGFLVSSVLLWPTRADAARE